MEVKPLDHIGCTDSGYGEVNFEHYGISQTSTNQVMQAS